MWRGQTAFRGVIVWLEYPSRRSEKVNFYFANYRFSFRKLQIFISQTTDFHFANYRFSFRKLQIFISQTTDFHFANYRFSFRKLQIFISQTTDSHFVSFHFVSFHFVSLHFVSQTTVSRQTTLTVILLYLWFGQERLQISPISEKENNDNLDHYLDTDNFPLGRRSPSQSCL